MHFRDKGKKDKRCPLCARDMNASVMSEFEKNVSSRLTFLLCFLNYCTQVNNGIKKSSSENVTQLQTDLRDWEEEVKRLQGLGVLAASRDKLNTIEVPALQKQIKEKEDELPLVLGKSEKVLLALIAADSPLTRLYLQALEQLNSVKKELKELGSLLQIAVAVSKNHQEIQRLKREISSIESDLMSTGSTKTAEDVQTELDRLSSELYVYLFRILTAYLVTLLFTSYVRRQIEREKQTLTSERERQQNTLRTNENDLHALQLNLSEVKNQLLHKSALEKRIGELKYEVTESSGLLKVTMCQLRRALPLT